MTTFDKPNYTSTPNTLFDDLMKDMSEAELKVTLAIVRQTFGYHKKSDAISLTQLEKVTGLSRTACVDGVESVIKRGLVIKTLGKRNISIFTLAVNDNQSTEATSTSSQKLPDTSSNLLHTKETEKETVKETSDANASEAVTPPDKPDRSNPTFDAVCEYIFLINPKEVNGQGGRIGPIAAWLDGKSDGMKRTGGKVGFISKPAEPRHIQLFARYWKQKYQDASMPLDFVKFVEAWRAWATSAAKREPKVYDDPSMDLSKPMPNILSKLQQSELERKARENG